MKPTLPLLALASLALSAQEPAIGLRAQALIPMGDLRSLTGGQVGIGGGVFVTIPGSRGLVLRPTVGGQIFPKGDPGGLTGSRTTVYTMDLMMEALWYPGEDPARGPYLVGALGGQHWRVSPQGGTATPVTATRLGASGGLGWQFAPNVGLEVRGFWSPISQGLTASGLQAAVAVSF